MEVRQISGAAAFQRLFWNFSKSHRKDGFSWWHLTSIIPSQTRLHHLTQGKKLDRIVQNIPAITSSDLIVFNHRSKLYHFIVWSVSLIFASCLAGKHYINGYWSVNDSVDDTAICWISLTRGEKFSNPYPWLFFYVPIIVVYLYAVAILIIAYQRLKSGISDTILHRLQALVVNSINVTVYVIYWFIEFVLYLFAFDPDLDEHTADIFLKTFLFIIASKGIFALSVWILSANVAKKVAKQDTSDVAGGIDLNGALRSEVLAYATRFIRHCAQKGATLQKNQPEQLFRITHKEDDGAKNPLSPWFFVCLLVGRDKERQELKMLAKKSRRRSVMPDIRASQDARLSQRWEM